MGGRSLYLPAMVLLGEASGGCRVLVTDLEASCVPQSPQYCLVSGLSALHFGHFMLANPNSPSLNRQ